MLKVIDMDNYSVIKEYSEYNSWIYQISKIKVPEVGEYIICCEAENIKILN